MEHIKNIQRARKRSSISYPNIKTAQGYNSATNKLKVRDTKGSQNSVENIKPDKLDIPNSNNLISDSNIYFN